MPAETVFRNGIVITVDEKQPSASAVAVRNGRIISVGDNQQIADEIGPNTRVIDLDGRTLMPGINDNHCHPMGFGASLGWIDATAIECSHAIRPHGSVSNWGSDRRAR